MLSWVASLAVFGAVAQPPSLNKQETVAWQNLKPSLVVLSQPGSPRGLATLIDGRGFFVADRSVVQSSAPVEGKSLDGHRLTLRLISVDDATQLALLKSDDPIKNPRPVAVYSEDGDRVEEDHPKKVLAILVNGPMRADLVSTSTLGLMHSYRSIATFSEIQFESPSTLLVGAPVFTLDGKLVGILQATLQTSRQPERTYSASSGAAVQNLNVAPKRYGPESVTVGYSPSPGVMKRVVGGFLTASHAVKRPAIGVFCKDAPHGGALVSALVDGSPAESAGIREGDVILIIEGKRIRGKTDFARVMLDQQVGSEITITVRRRKRLMNFAVRVGM